MALGILGIAVYVVVRIHGTLSSRAALARFEASQQPAQPGREDRAGKKLSLPQPREADFSLWSEKRVRDYKESLALNRGVGRIIGTSKPGQPGNVGIAGHRDGFFAA